jgi:hypothetical protein
MLDSFKQFLEGIGSGRITVLWWDPRIHWSDRLPQMMRMIDRFL